jgi:uncharacterized protein (TIGR04255 family)
MSEESGPLAGLPPANRKLLVSAPLELAIAEIRFSAATFEITAEIGLRFRERLAELGVPTARIEPMHQQRVSVNVQAGVLPSPQVEAGTQGWLLVSSDNSYQITIMPGSVVFQTAKYHRWSVTFRPRLEAIFSTIAELLDPVFVSRIGLRYVDRFVDASATSPAVWMGRLSGHFLGPICDPQLGSLVRGAQQQVELQLGDAQGALMRHGPFVDPANGGALSYLLDIDVFDTEPSRFDPTNLIERIEILNRTAASLFQLVLTSEYLNELQAEQAELEKTEQTDPNQS